MIKRTLYFGNPAQLRKHDDQLVIIFPETEFPVNPPSIPIEDIGMVVIDHPQITISHGLMESLTENNAAILFCDSKHMPHGLLLPMSAHNTYTENVRKQIAVSEPLKKQLWKQTVQQKLRNQSALLKEAGKPWEMVQALSDKVGSGDPANIEGQAAAIYWKYLFEEIDGFTRGREGDAPNHMLNYAYAILRATIARSLVGSGMLPLMGIHHRNKYNPFCLADDIMEPYRPYVDRLVFNIVRDYDKPLPAELDKELKAQLLQIPVLDVLIEDKKSPLMIGTQRTSASLMRCFSGENRKIAFPEM